MEDRPGLQQLRQTGWIRNQARVIVARFLVQHLPLSWQSDTVWCWDTLVDADLASSITSWEADTDAQRVVGIVIGRDYPMPVVDLAEGRARALPAFSSLHDVDA